MKITNCRVENFASYESLDIDLADKGLVLIQGPTGSGKSTICDITPWCLFGRTAKDGAVDEIRSWNTDEPTSGVTTIDGVTITRTRGRTAKDNDLFFIDSGKTIRGKDLKDTQRLLEERLGISYNLYLAGAYLHEFSQSAAFFTSSAQQRRNVCEQIVDLNLPKTLIEKISARLKNDKQALLQVTTDIKIKESEYSSYKNSYQSFMDQAKEWELAQKSASVLLIKKRDSYQQDSENKIAELNKKQDRVKDTLMLQAAKVDDILAELKHLEGLEISDICSKCGSPSLEARRMSNLTKDLNRLTETNDLLLSNLEEFERQITDISISKNPYEEQIANYKNSENPHSISAKSFKMKRDEAEISLALLMNKLEDIKSSINDLETLEEAVNQLRVSVINNATADVELSTNHSLSTYFDAELKVEFKAEDADKLAVTIYKDENICSYAQLSKGQRGLLKLCFGIAIMKQVAKYSNINFQQIFFDEALDGLDEALKIKAFRLLESLALEYGSVFVVEHSTELKAMFDKHIKVELINDISVIQCQL